MFKHFTCSFWILLLHSLSATTSNMTVRVRVEAKLQCLGASSLEAGLLSTPFVLYLFPSFQTGPELDGNSKACSKSIDCMDEARLVFFSKCLYFVQPIKDLLSNNECIEYYKWVIKFKTTVWRERQMSWLGWPYFIYNVKVRKWLESHQSFYQRKGNLLIIKFITGGNSL